MANEVLDQRYELIELVGSGGMADVYRAQDLLLGRPVAVKILHDQYRSDAEFIGKFHHEAQAAARLSHPNVVNIYDVGVSGNLNYIVMEYVPGKTLKELIKEQGHLPVKTALKIARGIADALAAAHAAGLVHCDIKPHNILMMEDGRVKVADFGIARAVTESTMTYSGNVVGSVHYFSPEQAKGTLITPKSDVYSLGVVLYEMLTGKLPFTGETPVAIAMKHLQEEPVPVRQLMPEIPPAVEALVSRMMAKDPNLRPTAAECAASLKQAERALSGDVPRESDPYATQVLPRVAPIPSRREKRAEAVTDEEEPQKKGIFHSKAFVFGLVCVLILGFGVGAFLSFGKFWSGAEVTVPDVTGKQLTLARQILEDSNLRVNVAETYSADVAPGEVVSQDPEAGSKVKEERLVTIYVSKGGEDLTMPDLQGLSKADAVTKLERMGLKLGTAYERNDDEEAGTVIGEDPRAGSKLSKGESVDLIISKGPKKKMVTVPSVTGASQANAEAALTARGLAVGSVTEEESSQTEGTVLRQSLASGSEAEEGESVDLVIAKGRVSTQETRQQSGTAKQTEKNVPQKDDTAKTQ